MMTVKEILSKVDGYFAQNQGEEAEKLLLAGIDQAEKAGDDSGLLMLQNELMGYYRETSRTEESYRWAEQAQAGVARLGLSGTLAEANTLLNIANAYRAGGRLNDSMECYRQVMAIYQKELAPADLLIAGLHNNISLLYQEMGDFFTAKEHQLKALAVAEGHQAKFETAVTCANLAATYLVLEDVPAAEQYCRRALTLFREEGITDSHYCAALAAQGTLFYRRRDYRQAGEAFRAAMEGVRRSLGENESYLRLKENAAACDAALAAAGEQPLTGLALCRAYYETYGMPMIKEQFGEYEDKIAVGLAGEGSDCFGYDDEISRDHDWGPGFCMWVSEATYEAIGDRLQAAYEALPAEFMGYRRQVSPQGRKRVGVSTVTGFYTRLVGGTGRGEINWHEVPDSALAAAVNGAVFRDREGIFSGIRRKLRQGYPLSVRYLKIAESCARFSQCGQYNYQRMLARGDGLTAQMMLGDCIREAMKLLYYIANSYPPHDKWLCRGLSELAGEPDFARLLTGLLMPEANQGAEAVQANPTDAAGTVPEIIEEIAGLLAFRLYRRGFTSDTEAYLDSHTEELLLKSALADKSIEELAQEIAAAEFAAFDRVRNVGGRASCQDDWPTFSIMRRSQYLTWEQPMLMQYLYDFKREYARGHNLIEEKYGRMMASTAPAEYAEIAGHFPVIDESKAAIIESVVTLQTEWMEGFEKKYPHLAGNARRIHTYEDSLTDTSYETYLRGEISTYSDKMLELYGRYVAKHAQKGRNLAIEIMRHNVRLYGYQNLAEAEQAQSGGDQ